MDFGLTVELAMAGYSRKFNGEKTKDNFKKGII